MRQTLLFLSLSILVLTSCQKIETIDSKISARPSGGNGGGGSTVNLTQGLVAFYPFNGNANDASGNGNNGTINGATLTTDRFNRRNRAYSFDGVNNFIKIEKTVTAMITGSYSVAFWIKANDTTLVYDGHEAIGDRDATTFDFKFRLNFGILQSPFFQNTYLETCSYGNANCSSINTSLPNSQKWEFYSMVYDSSLLRFSAYKNGILLGSLNNVPFSSGNRQINLGRCVSPDHPNGTSFYNGKIDEVRIYNRVLNQAEITYLARN